MAYVLDRKVVKDTKEFNDFACSNDEKAWLKYPVFPLWTGKVIP